MEQLNAIENEIYVDVDVTEFDSDEVDDEAVTLRSNTIAQFMTNFENGNTNHYTENRLADLVEKLDAKAAELKSLLSEAEQKFSQDYRKLICPVCLCAHARKHQQNCELLALISEANKEIAGLITVNDVNYSFAK